MVTVVIVSFDRFQQLMACIESVSASDPRPPGGLQVLVVTSQYSPTEVASIESAGATVVRLPHRAFVAEAHNAGVATAQGELLLFLDDDNVIAADAVSRLALAMDAWRDAVLVGPVMYYGSEPERIWCAGVSRSSVLMRTTFRSVLPDPLPERLDSEDFPNCFMVRRQDFDAIGGFDVERFPQHMAEADFAIRLARATGGHVYCVPRAKVWHFIGSSFLRRLHVQDSERAYWVSRGRTVFTAVYGNRLQWFLYVVLGQWGLAAIYVWAILVQSSSKRGEVAVAYMKGFVAGLRIGFADRRGLRSARAAGSVRANK
jgi:GT2 family glycosyltransferase